MPSSTVVHPVSETPARAYNRRRASRSKTARRLTYLVHYVRNVVAGGGPEDAAARANYAFFKVENLLLSGQLTRSRPGWRGNKSAAAALKASRKNRAGAGSVGTGRDGGGGTSSDGGDYSDEAEDEGEEMREQEEDEAAPEGAASAMLPLLGPGENGTGRFRASSVAAWASTAALAMGLAGNGCKARQETLCELEERQGRKHAAVALHP